MTTARGASSGDGRGEFVGLLVAPVVATLLWAAVAFVWLTVLTGLGAARRNLLVLALGGLFVGLPIAVMAVLFLATPVYLTLVFLGRVSLRSTLYAGVGVGALVVGGIRILLPDAALLNLPVGALVGLGTALTWWAVARRL